MKTTLNAMGIRAAGMVTGVGLTAPATCAAIRCAIDQFSSTRFLDKQGEWIVGSPVKLEKSWHGITKLARMTVAAIRECLMEAGALNPADIPLILCVAEQDRPGRIADLESRLFEDIQSELGARFHPLSDVISAGRVSGARALQQARMMIHEEQIPYVLIAGVDSFLSGTTLQAFEAQNRLLTTENSNGFIPGEAAAAILVGAPDAQELVCLGIGEGQEKATIMSEEPLRADGLVEAFQAAVRESGCDWNALDYRLVDCNGEEYKFREASLALYRLLRVNKNDLEIWHPADCIGEIGAAIVPCLVGMALQAQRKGYAPGRGALAHVGNDSGERYAFILAAQGGITG